MKKAGLFSVFVLLGSVLAVSGLTTADQAKEREALTKALQVTDPPAQIQALQQFIKDYPSSRSLYTAHQVIFQSYLEIGKDRKLLEYAENAINAAPESQRPMERNNTAWSLAENDVFLDKANEYATLAVEASRKNSDNKRELAMFLDTMAWIQYKRGDVAAAEKSQREAISYLAKGPNDILAANEYFFRLGADSIQIGGAGGGSGPPGGLVTPG